MTIRKICETDIGVDFGIVTIRDDEFSSVNSLLIDTETVDGTFNSYRFGKILDNDNSIRVAIAKVGGKGGRVAASHAARDLIEEMRPSMILVVGICGLQADDESTLGDVVFASRVYDFSVGALDLLGRSQTDQGGPVHPTLARILDAFPMIAIDVSKYLTNSSPPKIVISNKNIPSPEHRTNIKEKMRVHFNSNGEKARGPKIFISPINSGDNLIKDPNIAQTWSRIARDALAVEMELGGVYWVAQRNNVPLLGVRGVSDIIGFKRDPKWTQYACDVAASAAKGFMIWYKKHNLTRPVVRSPGQRLMPGRNEHNIQDSISRHLSVSQETAYGCSCHWGASIDSQERKVANTCEALIFLSRIWGNLSASERQEAENAIEFILELASEDGLPSLTFTEPYDKTIHCTSLGISALALIKKNAFTATYLPSERIKLHVDNGIEALVSAAARSINPKLLGWKTVTHPIDAAAEDIRIIPTLMVVRALRHAECAGEIRNKVINRLNNTVRNMKTGGLGHTLTDGKMSYAATFLLLSEHTRNNHTTLSNDTLNESLLLLNNFFNESADRWQEIEEYNINQYGVNIERVPFTHISYAHAISLLASLLSSFPSAVRDIKKLAEKAVVTLDRAEDVFRASKRLVYPTFLIASSLCDLRDELQKL